MGVPRDEHERTLAFAEIALGQIRALTQLASPRNYEIWYHYATGYNPALNQVVNQTLEEKGSLSESDLEHIHASYIATNRVSDRLDAVNGRIIDEVKQVLDMVGAAAGSATTYSESLAEATEKLSAVTDSDALRSIIDRLVKGTKEMEQNNKKLEAHLSASREEIEQLQQNLEAVRTESMTDPLTTLSNRKFFDQTLAKVMAEARLKDEPLSLLMCDIDHFKSFNDSYGHLTGDHVLRLVAIAVKQNVKGQDIAARYGGEEFVVALPNTALQSAITVAEHVRRAVMSKELIKRSTGEKLGRVTISIGSAVLHPNDTAQTLIERADKCLYAAKRNGRNRVMCETDPEAGVQALTPTTRVA
jgi:diguanylate cyclase